MCQHNSLLNAPMGKYQYDTWERNQAHEQLISCSSCSRRKQKRCKHKFVSQHKGTDSNKLRHNKMLTIQNRTVGNQSPPKVKKGVLLRRQSFQIEFTGKKISGRKQFKVLPIIYGRTVDRYLKLIHE